MRQLEDPTLSDLRETEHGLTYDPERDPDPALVIAHLRLVVPLLRRDLLTACDACQSLADDSLLEIKAIEMGNTASSSREALFAHVRSLADARTAHAVTVTALTALDMWLAELESDRRLGGLAETEPARGLYNLEDMVVVARTLAATSPLGDAFKRAHMLRIGAEALADDDRRRTRVKAGFRLVADHIQHAFGLLRGGLAASA